jgi:copper(I)-binding protein
VSARSERIATAALVVGACVALALAGCSAGQLTQTSNQTGSVPGANVSVGALALRNLLVQYNGVAGYAAGGDAPLEVRIFNDGATPVKLVGVRTDDATGVTLVGAPTPAVTPAPVSPSPSASPSESASTSPSASGEPAGSASPSASGSAVPPASPSQAPPAAAASAISIEIPPQSYVALVPGEGSHLRLTGLKEAVVPGDWVTVTFTFDSGVSLPVQIPLVAPPGVVVPRATPVVPPGEENHE